MIKSFTIGDCSPSPLPGGGGLGFKFQSSNLRVGSSGSSGNYSSSGSSRGPTRVTLLVQTEVLVESGLLCIAIDAIVSVSQEIIRPLEAFCQKPEIKTKRLSVITCVPMCVQFFLTQCCYQKVFFFFF